MFRLISREVCRKSYRAVPRLGRLPTVSIRPIAVVKPTYTFRTFRTSSSTRDNQTPLPSVDFTESQWLDYLHNISHSASQSPNILTELDAKNPNAGIFDAPNRMERAYALIFQLFLYLSRPQPESSPEHWLQTFETIPSLDGEPLHLARLCATHVVRTIVWELDNIPQDDPQRTKYPNVFEDARGLSLLISTYLKDQEGVPEQWPIFWSEVQPVLLALGIDLGDAGYAIQAPPETDQSPDTPGLTREQGFKGVDLTGTAGPPVRGSPNILETKQPDENVPDRIEMEFNRANGKEQPEQAEYWSKNPKKGGFF
ncbi:hypothetical protein RhiJN_07146 [Ceratobasidium sp. AG-Ba]|nr:hypothetical protein RhiJN_07146 [Ceratobasidium sp. AG-Ba]QRW08021.1 hypothetical protein RhiLY_07020 [Ceratobasidium sp. AG-Ba]